MLGLSAPFIPQFFKKDLDEVLPYVDVVLGNESEALAYAESHDLPTKSIEEIARKIAALPKQNTVRSRTVIITQGTDPTLVVTGDAPNAESFPVYAIDAKEINDTNGAGYVICRSHSGRGSLLTGGTTETRSQAATWPVRSWASRCPSLSIWGNG